jgi:uncharacterized protein (DUF433 family)
MTTATVASRISSKPGVCGGEACIDGTRIMIWLLVYLRRRGRSDAALLDDYPGLTPADLDAAWDYYRRNPLEIEQAVWRNTVAADHEPGAPVLAWVVVVARLIGLTDDQIRDAFDPPLDPARLDAAWEEYRRHPEQIDRRIAQNRVAASEDRPTTASGSSVDQPQFTTVAPNGKRFMVLDREWDTYQANLPELLHQHAGRYLLIRGNRIIGVWDTKDQALEEGYRRFLLGPFMVQHIVAEEKPIFVPRGLI